MVKFGRFVVERHLTELFDEAVGILEEFRRDCCRGLSFPVIEYRYFAIRALISDANGDTASARKYAETALAEAAKDHSGLRFHLTVGLVGTSGRWFEKQLKALAGS
jgi:hypothetical protein